MAHCTRAETFVLVDRVERAASGRIKPVLMATTSKNLAIGTMHILAFRLGLILCSTECEDDVLLQRNSVPRAILLIINS